MTAADQIVHDVKKRLANGGRPHMTGKQLRPAPSSSMRGRKIHERSAGRRAIAGAGIGVLRRWRTLQWLTYNSTTT
jgi:hypothetical protein